MMQRPPNIRRYASEGPDLTDTEVRQITSSRWVFGAVPRTCRSPSHRVLSCHGRVRTCPLCGTRVCDEDGAADMVDLLFPGICDQCWMGVMCDQGNKDEVERLEREAADADVRAKRIKTIMP